MGTIFQEDTLLSAEEIAERLNVSRSVVYRLASKGILPKVRVSSRLIRFRSSDVEAFLRMLCQQNPEPENRQ